MAHGILLTNFLSLVLILPSCIVADQLENDSNLREIIKSMRNEMKIQNAKVESDMKQMAENMLGLQRKVMNLEADIQQCQLNNTHENSKRLLVGSEPNPAVHVAFSARLTHNLQGLADNQVLIFDKEISDFGQVYDETDGIFIAPVSGVYVFTWTICTSADLNQATVLVKHGIEMGYSYSNSADNDSTQSSNTVVIQVNAGEHVMVKTSPWAGSSHVVDFDKANMFSGWLLWRV